ncbi:MAG: bifunctional homocysteine S-methyltransferase/methylenetetrahydrofolate reductase [Deltaproteobacteria bacterium]|nr:bifunctional homocysteine S-methyltransferase/methylenetetrahydrofolate reductase [Deltaproteobacteria bacterium]
MKNRFREKLEKRETIIFDGGMGTTLFDNGIFINRCYDQVNLLDPDLVKRIHKSFIDAGAMVIETNTFGANRFKLATFDLAHQIHEINIAGAKIAKEAAKDKVLVAGSVGPLGVHLEPLFGKIDGNAAKNAFKEQISALVEGGVDLILMETFSELEQMQFALDAVKELKDELDIDIPTVCSFTLNQEGTSFYGLSAEKFALALEKSGADMIGINCSTGPKPMLDAMERIRKVTNLPLMAMPNAGLPAEVEGRKIYVCSPDYMANYARRFVQVGACGVGGCCGTTPDHIKAISASVRQISSEQRSFTETVSVMPDNNIAMEELPFSGRSKLAAKLENGEFIATVELAPPQGWDLAKILVSAKAAKEAGFDAVNIPDGPRASARMGPLAMAVVIERDEDIETIMHYACRDRNLVGMQADLLGAYALGLRNILVITGDPPIMGDYPNATAVFDVDAIGLTKMISRLNTALDLGGRSIKQPTGFVPLVGLNPTAINPEKELERYIYKVKAGAKAVITQPVFDSDQLLSFLEKIPSEYKIPVIAGIWPLQSLRNAEFLANEMPGVSMPKALLDRMQNAYKNENEREEGKQVAIDILKDVLPRVQGIQVAAPFGRLKSATAVLNAAKAQLKNIK